VWFEREPPEAWPHQALAMVTTHDLPTLAGMALGSDAPGEMRENLERLVGPVVGRPPDDVAVDVHRHLGQSRAMLAVATMEDVLGVTERPNVPGTLDDERPNWSVGLPLPIEDVPADPGARRTLDALAEGRRSGSEAP
jgi:4-alpha-glucanotransferase